MPALIEIPGLPSDPFWRDRAAASSIRLATEYIRMLAKQCPTVPRRAEEVIALLEHEASLFESGDGRSPKTPPNRLPKLPKQKDKRLKKRTSCPLKAAAC